MPDKSDWPRNPVNAVFLIVCYIAMLVVPYMAMYYNVAAPAPAVSTAIETVDCSWSWKAMSCQPDSSCRFQLGAGCKAR